MLGECAKRSRYDLLLLRKTARVFSSSIERRLMNERAWGNCSRAPQIHTRFVSALAPIIVPLGKEFGQIPEAFQRFV
jgi:hypothetical protein